MGGPVRGTTEVSRMKVKEKGYLVVLLGIIVVLLAAYVGRITSNAATAVVGLVLLIAVAGLGFRSVKRDKDTNYPYRPGIEIRLPNGRITTRGYAGRHPREFRHWCEGPENVRGENIDPEDWEEWRRCFEERYRRV